jgi:Tetratricopeptide repeat
MVAIAQQINENLSVQELKINLNSIPHLEKFASESELLSDDNRFCLYLGIGIFYENIGSDVKAKKWYCDFLTNTNVTSKESLLNHATIKYYLGALLTKERSYDDGNLLLEESLNTRVQLLNFEHIDIAKVKFNLGMNFYYQGCHNKVEKDSEYEKFFKKAEQMALEALAIIVASKKHLIEQANCEDGISLIYQKTKRLKEAEKYSLSALKIRKDNLLNNHQDIFCSMNNLAGIYRDQKRFEDSIKLYTEVINLKKAMFGSGHLEIAITLNNLGACYFQKGDYNLAKKSHYKAYSIRKKHLESEDIRIGYSLKNLAFTYKAANRNKIAEVLLRQGNLIIEKRSSNKS